MSTPTLTPFDHGAIHQLLNLGYGINKIARTSSFSKSTISTEVRRGTPYNPKKALLDADKKRQYCGRKTSLTAEMKVLIENHLNR